MIKRLPSRNHRSKGIKVKHVLQIILLLGVCFWLIYQVKHSHDKKKEFDENDAKLSVKAADQIPKLGRKDLHPGKDGVNQNEKHEEEEEDEIIVEDEENKHEHDEQEEEEEGHKHEVREQGEDENKSEEMEDEGRGGGDDEIDENDQEKSEVDVTDHDEEFMDEEKEKEQEIDEKENENSEDEEKGGSVENHNTHEAREEHYKADDASSAVAHDTHTTGTETETLGLETSGVNSETSITKPENQTNYSDESNRNQNDSDLNVTEGELTDGTGNNSLSKLLDSAHLNETATTNSNSHSEASSNRAVVTAKATNNLTGTDANASSSSEQNKIVLFSESDHAQNATVNTTVTGDVKNVQTEGLEQSGKRVSEENLPDSNSTTFVKTENGDAAAGEKIIRSATPLNETEKISGNLDRKESIDASEHDKSKGNTETSETNEAQNNSDTKENREGAEDKNSKGDTQTGETDETSDASSADGTSNSVEHDAIDSLDSHIHKDVAEVRTDLDTLPDIRNGGDHNGDETAAE